MTTETVADAPIAPSVAVAALVGEIGNWPGVEVGVAQRFGGPEFTVGRRQLGHLHETDRGVSFADIPLPRRVRDELIAAGRARPHSAMPDSGWLTVPIRTVGDLSGALEVFRMAYDRATNRGGRR